MAHCKLCTFVQVSESTKTSTVPALTIHIRNLKASDSDVVLDLKTRSQGGILHTKVFKKKQFTCMHLDLQYHQQIFVLQISVKKIQSLMHILLLKES